MEVVFEQKLAKKIQAAHQHVDRKRSSGDGVHRNVSEKVGELLRVHRGGGDDQLQVAPAADDRPQDSEQDVGVERPLVSLVHDDGTETKQNGDLGCYGGRVGADCLATDTEVRGSIPGVVSLSLSLFLYNIGPYLSLGLILSLMESCGK